MKHLALLVVDAAIGLGQAKGPSPSAAGQQAANCSQNISGNNNTATVTCANVDKKLADQIAQLVMASKRDSKALDNISNQLGALLRDLQNPSQTIIQEAPNGINIGPGAIATNPQVINNQPPPPKLRFTEEISAAWSQAQPKTMIIHVTTDRTIAGAIVGIVMSGPFSIDPNKVGLSGAGATQFNAGMGLKSGTEEIPNSGFVIINIPAAFRPGQDLTIPVVSLTDAHVISVIPLAN